MFVLVSMLTPATSFARSAPWVGVDFKGLACMGSDTNQWYGPYDYTKPDQKLRLRIVNEHHFTPNVENHIKGQESSVTGDLNYTLMAGPNHHPALLSLVRFQIKLDKKLLDFRDDKIKKPSTPVECYFQRAINFSPDDAVTYSLFGYFLKTINRLEEAKKYYEKALELSPENSKIAYSFSLLLIDLKQYEKAVSYAKIAYKKGKPPAGLRDKLDKLGVWKE